MLEILKNTLLLAFSTSPSSDSSDTFIDRTVDNVKIYRALEHVVQDSKLKQSAYDMLNDIVRIKGPQWKEILLLIDCVFLMHYLYE